jgi:L-lactate dehydrogenase (cytochrome)
MAESKLVSFDELSTHNTPEDCWVVIGDEVWDVSEFAPAHPGGSYCMFECHSRSTLEETLMIATVIYKYAANDATEAFSEVHDYSVLRDNLPFDRMVGALDRSSTPKIGTGQQQQKSLQKSGSELMADQKPPLHSILNRYS